MNGYQLTDAWFEFRFQHPEKVTHAHTELYFYLVYHWNKLSQKEKIGLPSAVTMEATGIRNYKTYRKCVQDLAKFGFIRIVSEAINQHQAMVVAWGKNTKADTEALPEALTKAQHEALPHIGELNNLGTKEHIDIKPKAKKKKEKVQFIAPTIEQVQEYFTEKAYPIQLVEKVFNHYNDKEWHKSNGQPVIDWKRTISNNWEDHFQQWRQRQTSNVNRGNSQPQVDPSKIINYGKGNGAVVYSEKYNVYYEPIQNGQPPKEVTDLIYLDQGNHGHYGEYVKWMLMNDKQPMPPEDTRYFPDDFNFEKFISEQKAILANSNQ
jgi:hypothetical protein